MERLLYDILTNLEEKATELGLSYVDEDFGQLEAIDEEGKDTYPLTYPAVLCEVQGVNWSHTDRLQQEGSATIAVRLLIDCYDDTHINSTTIGRILERSQLNRNLTETLHGMRILGNSASLTRISSSSYNGPHLIKVYETVYTAKVWERFDNDQTAPVGTICLSGELKV